MAARTGGNVVANIMDHLESTLVTDIGGLTSGAAINQFTVGGWFTGRLFDNTTKTLAAFRDAEATTFGPYMQLRQYGVGDASQRTPTTTRNDGSPAATHQTRSTEFEADGETDKYPIPCSVDKLWWLAMSFDASAALDAPDIVQIWSYSPPAALGGEDKALRMVPMGHGPSELNDFIRNTWKFCLGGWSGLVTDPVNQVKAHQCDFQDWWFIPAIITAQQAADLASGKAASSVLANVAGRKVWSLRESASPFKETFNSGDNLTSVGTVSVVSNFAGVTVMPVTVLAVADAYIQSSGLGFPSVSTIRVGVSVAGVKIRTMMKGTHLITGLGIPSGSTINLATLNMQCTTAAVEANRFFRVRRFLKGLVEDTGFEGGWSWTQQEYYAGGSGTNWGAAGGDLVNVDYSATGQVTFGIPTTTGAKTFDITTVIQACLDAGGDVLLQLLDDEETAIPATSGVAQFGSLQGVTPWTIDVTYTAPATGFTELQKGSGWAAGHLLGLPGF